MCDEMNGVILEAEGYCEESPVDEIYVRNADGRMVKLEVADDVADD